ncbi:AraC family transcriptional regulator [Acinetobacter sp. ANC 4558]|uniref:AraC family transcriptional regulator n=1 Tax=Acinetobacter sp. ANC 4558 TaxID=1977876 RepID=UPI000A359253|nr:helix-turn-helix transcriptional regulator [Acinetobacter sp. ANC 4558]OTG79844.1 AraC family transcriptional regulator [Acinetobacter sp. ANC 4558]
MPIHSNLASTLLISMGSRHQHGSIIAPHSHDRAQLLYASKGTIRVQTADHIWLVPPQCALWIPAFIEHGVTPLSEVRLSTVLVEQSAAYVMGEKCFLVRMTNLLKELVLRFNQLDMIEKTGSPYSEDLEKSLQLLIFDEIKQALTYPIEIPWPKDKRLVLVCEQLILHPEQCKDLNIWSDRIGTSSRTLMRLFRKETGLSYRAWIQQMHVVLALDFLAQGETISYIAKSLGYTNASAFSAMFKRHLGYSPQKFK